LVVTWIYPSANGTYQQNLVYGAATHWQAVLADDSSYLYETNKTWKYDTFVLSPSAIPANALISKVTLYGYAYCSAGCSGQVMLLTYFDSDLDEWYWANVEGGNDVLLVEEFTTAPDDTPWLRADLDSIQFGIATLKTGTGGTVAADYISVKVEYTIPPSSSGAQIIGLEAW